VNLAALQPASNTENQTGGIMQGNKVIEIAAKHELTAQFIVGKIAQRIFEFCTL
jgi:uncharacterized protein (DUF1800 family)